MDDNLPRVLQINTQDCTGGAAHIARDLFKGLERRGCISYFVVGIKESHDTAVVQIPNNKNRNLIARFFISCGNLLKRIPLLHSGGTGLTFVGQPTRLWNYLNGFEDFNFPGTHTIPTIIPGFKPDIIHCHNLHGEYFDLRELPALTREIPVLFTLHDAWLLSGHCAHSFACEKWKTGCGPCPALTTYPAILRDASEYNWKRKREIFKKSRLYIVTPCQWLMEKVDQSILKPGIVGTKIIPNGVDLNFFHPADQRNARIELGLPLDKKIILFTANGIRKNIWKDYRTLQSTLAIISQSGKNVLCIALGERAHSEYFGDVEIRFIPPIWDPKKVAGYYQAADVYAHPARAETFPTAILEALACGTPVVASAIGGIPEQIMEGKTGFLVPAGDAHLMAKRIMQLLLDDDYRQQMGREAANDAVQRFGLDRMITAYLSTYREFLNHTPGYAR